MEKKFSGQCLQTLMSLLNKTRANVERKVFLSIFTYFFITFFLSIAQLRVLNYK